MIFFVYTADAYHNMRLKHQARAIQTRLNRTEKHQLAYPSKEDYPLKTLKPGETLYIIGHGNKDNPSLSGLSVKQLYNLLIENGLNIHLKSLRLFLICCHAGFKPSKLEYSYSEKLYQLITNNLSDLELHHRYKEETLPKVVAPKHVIRLTAADPNYMGIPQEQYTEYETIRSVAPSSLDKWLTENATPLKKYDFEFTSLPCL